ncbi:hypothetical protein MBAV_003709, partial [Candidatus Magnetobacterium bavaricum]
MCEGSIQTIELLEEELRRVNEALQREIAGREEAEKQALQNETKYRLLLNNIPQKVFYKDR